MKVWSNELWGDGDRKEWWECGGKGEVGMENFFSGFFRFFLGRRMYGIKDLELDFFKIIYV